MTLVLVLALLLGLLPAAPQGPVVHVYYRTMQNPVEQQTCTPDRTICGALTPQEYWVRNTTGCFWDADDATSISFSGRLERGQSVSHTDCVILDNASHLVGLVVGDGLTGSITIDGALPGYFGGTTAAADCLLTPQYGYPEYLSLPVVSNGHGSWATVTWTITNNSHKPQKIGARGELRLVTGQAMDLWGCP